MKKDGTKYNAFYLNAEPEAHANGLIKCISFNLNEKFFFIDRFQFIRSLIDNLSKNVKLI